MKRILSFIFAIMLSSVVYCQTSQDSKEKTIDVTQNENYIQAKALMQAVGDELKVPAEKVYTTIYKQQFVYVKIAIISISVLAIITIGFLIAFFVTPDNYKYCDRKSVFIAGGIGFLIFTLIAFFTTISYIITAYQNPDYNAIHDTIGELSRLLPS